MHDLELVELESRGPMHGILVAPKDSHETEGIHTTGGARIHAENTTGKSESTPAVPLGAVLYRPSSVRKRTPEATKAVRLRARQSSARPQRPADLAAILRDH